MGSSSNRKLQKLGVPKLFNPAVSRENNRFSVPREVNLGKLAETNYESTASFRYDPAGSGLKSTQELPLDWSKFENHTFFNSARAKVNVAFDKIVNEFPFDGTAKEVEAFEDGLTGFEKYILDIFPKNTGFLFFSGTALLEDPARGYAAGLGTNIKVLDSAGALFPDFSRDKSGSSVIDFSTNPFSIEFLIRVPEDSTSSYQVICQKQSGSDQTVTLALDQSITDRTVDLLFFITSGSAKLFTSASIEKGKFSHICATYDRGTTDALMLYLSESLISTSSTAYEFDTLSFNRAPLYIGSGSAFIINKNSDVGGTSFTPAQTLSGALDEFRIFHSVRSIDDQKKYARKSIYSTKDLKLYFKFNEPSGSFNGESVVLDSSGNSLHSTISNFSGILRNTGSYTNPMSHENIDRAPILFPSFEKVSDLNQALLVTGSAYDRDNPNLVTRLVPVHYLLEGQAYEGMKTQDGQVDQPVTANSIPGSAKMGNVQHLTEILFVWAKFFDEIKIFIDHFGNVLYPSYDDDDTVASKLLPFVSNYYGMELPAIFPSADPTQYIDGEDIQDSYSRSVQSLSFIQGEIWRRILINLNEIIRSKGTIHAIKSLIRAAGINPDSLMNIREYGGPTKRSLSGLRETRTLVASSLDFSGSSANVVHGTLDGQGFATNIPSIVSPFLSSSRLEVGFPEPVGTMVFKDASLGRPHGISNNSIDGILTSGSFTYEGTYQFNSKNPYSPNQSIARLQVSGSGLANTGRNGHGFALANLIIASGTLNSITGSGSTLKLYVLSSQASTDPLLKLELPGPDLFDGNKWNISFGRARSDERLQTDSAKYTVEPVSSAGSSSYFIRCARQAHGEIKEIYTTASYFQESQNTSNNIFQNFWSRDSQNYGPKLVVGSQSMAHPTAPSNNYFLNDTGLDSRPRASAGDRQIAMSTNFQGEVSQIRFWSKYLEKDEWQEHVRNFKSVGVNNPLVNFNFDVYPTGAWGRIRADISIDQYVTTSNASGIIHLTDFSQNSFFMTGSGFERDKVVIKPETFYYSFLSPKFDVAQTDNKVRIRGYELAENIEQNSYAYAAPQYEVVRSELPDDDTRFSVDFSSVKALDEDIMNMFGSLDFFNNALGAPNLIFDDSYPEIDQARKIYFNRLMSKPEYQVFFDMYKWFNSSIGMIIEQLIPRKTKFLGVNFIIESHVLERNRFRYLFDDIYLLSLQRDTSRGNIFLSQIVGNLKKF